MTHDEDFTRVLRDRLRESRVDVTLTAPVTEYLDYDDRGVAKWSGEAYIEVYANPDCPDASDETAFLARGDVALTRRPIPGAPGSETLVVATASGLVIDVDAARNLATVLDESADFAHFMPLFFDRGELNIHEDFDELIEGLGSRVILLDRAQLAPAWRGLGGVGRLLTARMLQWLLSGALVVVTQPAPFELSREEDEPGYMAGLQQVRGVWGSLGFRLWQDDIWYLAPAMDDFGKAVANLEDRLGLRRS
ncbi:hypothetical protein ACI78V_02110 [Geodermatophilus sp. SYSU D00742]